jgi:uncharacterized protein YegJ (DUF2314 family)
MRRTHRTGESATGIVLASQWQCGVLSRHFMKQFLIILALVIILFALGISLSTKAGPPGQSKIYSVRRDDLEMNAAMNTASQTIDVFKKALASNDSNYKFFAIKSRFDIPNGEEHIWLKNIFIKNNNFWGIVDSKPITTSEIKAGDKIQIKTEMISDWMFIDCGKLKGGYTIRILRARMSEDDKKRFDSENNIIIED